MTVVVRGEADPTDPAEKHLKTCPAYSVSLRATADKSLAASHS